MCGLAGIASADPRSPVDEPAVRRMIAALAHRGPDGEGIRSLPGCVLAHRRLAIVDLSERAAQPMANEDSTIWVVFNGEIYNHVELRRELKERHAFRSESDTETILHLYEDHGPALLDRLRGMFAFALWDARKERLLLARDRLGKKPLHYRLTAEGIAFASEIPALLAGGAPREFDTSILGTYLCLGYVPAPRTALKGILRLPAGSLLIYERGRVTTERYWSPPLPHRSAREMSARDAAKAILPILDDAVRIRLRSDVPLGVFLSGGLDSAVVAALAARHTPGPLKTFTVVFDEQAYDESEAARSTAASLGSDHHEIRVRTEAAETLPSIIRTLGEPLADSSLIAVHRLSKEVRREVKVALSGDGGDEVFLGYDRYRAHRLADRFRRLPALARRAAGAAAAAMPGPRGRRNLAGRAGRFLEAAAEDPLSANDRWLCRFAPSALAGVITGEAAESIPPDPLEPLHALYAEAAPAAALDVVARADLLLWLPDDVLRKVDAASMACGLEVRSPLLDHEVVRAAVTLPASVRMSGSRGKEILRECAGGALPEAIVFSRKAGFGLPVDRWLRSGALGAFARDTLTAAAARSRGLVRPEAVVRLLDEHASGSANHDEAIWTLLVLEVFLREVVDASR